jgi:Cell wall-associated hydrolases (invasion-associated proteins)
MVRETVVRKETLLLRFTPSLIAAVSAAGLLYSTPPAFAQTKPVNPTFSRETKWVQPKTNRHQSLGSRAANQALSYRGVPYSFGGQSRKGIDCSALIQTAYKKWGILLPRTSVEQHKKGIAVPKAQMKPGDLVFFKNTYKRGISHVGIYMGNNQFVHASSGRGHVTISSLGDPYYQNHWAGARRIALDKEPIYPADDEDKEDPTIACDAIIGDKSADNGKKTTVTVPVTTVSEITDDSTPVPVAAPTPPLDR